MPSRDSNAAFLFLVVLIAGAALAALSNRSSPIPPDLGSSSSSNNLYEASESWRTSVKIYAAAR